MKPDELQNLVELFIDFFVDLLNNAMEKYGRNVFPLIASLGLFILFGNLLGLAPGFEASTERANTTPALAIPVFVYIHYFELKHHGASYIKHCTGTMIALASLMLPIELIRHLARPIAFRAAFWKHDCQASLRRKVA